MRSPDRCAELLRALATAEAALRTRRGELEPAATAALEARRKAIQRATAAGLSRGELARLTGLSRGTIQQIAPTAARSEPGPRRAAIDSATRARLQQDVLDAHRVFQQATADYLAQLEPVLSARNTAIKQAAEHCTRRQITQVTNLSVKRVQELVRGTPYPTGRRKRQGA